MGGGERDCLGDLQEEPWLHDEGVRAGPREGPQVEGMNTAGYSANWIDVSNHGLTVRQLHPICTASRNE